MGDVSVNGDFLLLNVRTENVFTLGVRGSKKAKKTLLRMEMDPWILLEHNLN